MLKKLTILIFILAITIISNSVSAQALTGIKTINAQGSGTNNYVSLKSAIDSLNKYGVGIGGVIFNISANHVEQAPLKGYQVWRSGDANKKIIFQKSGIGENPVFTAYKGLSTFKSIEPDGIFNIIGSDYVELNGLTFKENINNVTSADLMEYGIGVFMADTDDISHHINIRNCKIELSRNNVSNVNENSVVKGSAGLLIIAKPYTYLTYNKIRKFEDAYLIISSNDISNVNTGIEVNGKLNGIEISNNKIKDFGNNIFSSIVSQGISVNNAKNYKIVNNEIISDYYNSTIFSEIKKSIGIKLNNEIETPSNDLVENNYIKMVSNNNVDYLFGIEANNLDTLNIIKNTIDTLSIYTSDTSSLIAIDIQKTNLVRIDSNLIQNQIYYTPDNGLADIFNIKIEKCIDVDITSNNIKFTRSKNKSNNRKTYANIYVLECNNVNIKSNDIEIYKSSIQNMYKYYTIYTFHNNNTEIYKNKIHSLNTDKFYSVNSSAIYSIDFSSTISHNTVENVYSYNNLTIINCEQLNIKNTYLIKNNIIRNVNVDYGDLIAIRTYKYNASIYNNRIYNINLINYGSIQVIRIDLNEKVKIFNNSISNINAFYISTIGANPFIIAAIYVKSSNIKNSLIEIYNNSIRLHVSNTSTNLLTACVYHENYNKFNSAEELLLFNNIFNNYSSVSSVNQNSSANIIFTQSESKFYSIHKLSNNNIYYLGTAKLRRHFYRDFAASYLNFDSYKAFGYPRDTKSSNTSVDFRNHLIADLGFNDSTINYAESNGKHIFDNKFDINGKKRPGYTYSKNNSGYGTDIGAFEFDGIDTSKKDNKTPIIELDFSTTNIDVCNDSTHKFKLYVYDQSKINSVKLYWKDEIDSIYSYKLFDVINDTSYEVKLNLNSNYIEYYFEVIDSLNNISTSETYKFNSSKIKYKLINNEVYTRLGDTIKYNLQPNLNSATGKSKNAFISTNYIYGKYSDSGNSISFLYTADELKASGLKKGHINSIMFKNLNHATGFNLIIDRMSISMSNTKRKTIDVDSIFNIQTVYETTNYWPTIGENNHHFNTPFYWDGVSNIIIKICTESKESSFHNWEGEHIYANDSTSIYNYGLISTGNSCLYYYSPSYLNAKPLIYFQYDLILDSVYWYTNDSNANIINSNGIELIAKPLATGDFTYIRASSLNNCINLDTLKVHVNLFEQLNLEDTLYICENDLKEFDAKNKGSNYWWYLNNQFISNNQKIYANTTGNYIVVIRDNLNNTYIDSSYLIAYNVENVNLGTDTQICGGGTYELLSNVIAHKYLWSNGDTTNSTTVYYTNDVKLRAIFKNGCSSEDEINVNYDGIVNLDPYHYFYPDTVFKYFLASQRFQDNAFYIWNMDDPLSTENVKMGYSVKHKFITKKDLFNISVRAYVPGYSCVYNDTLIFQLVGINELKSKFDINVYPNPIENNTTINYRLNENDNLVSIKVFDVLGRETTNIINNENQSAGNYQYNLNEIKSLAKGIYLLNININGQTFSQKLIND